MAKAEVKQQSETNRRNQISRALEGHKDCKAFGVAPADWSKVKPELREAIIDAIDHKDYPVYMFGDPGRGKSCAMSCVMRLWSGPLWCDANEIVRRVIRCRMSKNGSISRQLTDGGFVQEFEGTILNRVENAKLVCFDDVGVRSLTDAGREIFEQMVNSRFGKRTFYSSNHTPESLERVFDSRITSRLFSGTVLEVTGKDQRMEGVRIKKV